MADHSTAQVVRELHADLSRKYRRHKAAVETAWRSFDKKQREKCMRAGAMDGAVLEHSLDPSMGNVCKFIPEWNLRDVAQSGPDFLLELLQRRTAMDLHSQYADSRDGIRGDCTFIEDMMQRRGLQLKQPYPSNSYNIFIDGDQYGSAFTIPGGEIPDGLRLAYDRGFLVKQSVGELILTRQMYLLQGLNIIIEDILEEGSRTRHNEERGKKSDKAAAAALSNLSISQPLKKLTLSDVIASARDQKETLEEYLNLLTTEPVVLAHAVNITFYSRPELVADEKGRHLPLHTDKYISAAFFDAIHNAVQAVAIWNYLASFLQLFEEAADDKVSRAVILQEIANICALEYGRAQDNFKRQVQTASGKKWFQRSSNALDKAGNARVSMKGKPEDHTRSNPGLHYMLRLCQAQTSPAKAVDWIKKLGDLHEADPDQRDMLGEREAEPLYDLIVIVGFIQDLFSVVTVPSLSRKDGQAFITRSQKLQGELSELKKEIDLRDFAVPIDNLLEPGMADAALKAMDQFVIDKVGTKLGFLYYDMVTDCLSDLRERCKQAKAKQEEQKKKIEQAVPSFQEPVPEAPPKPAEPRKHKEKTRPAHSSVYEITPHPEPVDTSEPSDAPAQKHKVSAATAQVFSTLFDKTASRGSITWADFEAALAELGFSVFPKYGSVYTFKPPEGMAVRRPITLHRPHRPKIEGYSILILAKRLRRVYGWGEKTFEAK